MNQFILSATKPKDFVPINRNHDPILSIAKSQPLLKVIRTSTVSISLNILLKGQLNYLNQYFDVLAVSSDGEDMRIVEEREGVKVMPISMERKISPFKDLKSLIKLYFLFKREKPYIVHSITPKAGLLSMVAAYFARVPVRIHTFTGLIFPSKLGSLRFLLIFMDKMLCKFATHIYPEGEGVKADLIANKITKKPLNIIANGNVNGIDLEFFSPDTVSLDDQERLRNDLEISLNDFVYIFIGRLVGDKGINELVAAFKRISLEEESAKLILVGPFELDQDPVSQDTLSEIDANKNIILTGFQNDIRAYLSISNALVFPSYREGFPNVVMQAGAMGLPAIVTDINGCNEIIVDGRNGLIIPSKSSADLYVGMKNFIQNPMLIQKLKSCSRSMISQRYEQLIVWEAVLLEYRRCIKK